MPYFSIAFGQWSMVPIWIAAIGIVGLLIRQIVPWKKLTSDAESRLIETLIDRVQRLEAKSEQREAKYAARERLGSHKLRNIQAAFDSMLMMLETSPDRVPEIIAAIKEMRAAQMLAEAQEAAIIRAAEITADDHLDLIGEPLP